MVLLVQMYEANIIMVNVLSSQPYVGPCLQLSKIGCMIGHHHQSVCDRHLLQQRSLQSRWMLHCPRTDGVPQHLLRHLSQSSQALTGQHENEVNDIGS